MPKGIALVVDRDAHSRSLLTLPLIACGYRIQEAEGTQEATALILTVSDIRCVVLGADLPLTTTSAVAQYVRQERPVDVAVLAQFLESTLVRGATQLSSLIDDFCVRPCGVVELRERVRRSIFSLADRRRFQNLQSITERQSSIDPQTGLLTCRSIAEHLRKEISRSHRSGRVLSLLLVTFVEPNDAPTADPQSGGNEFFELTRRIADSIRNHDVCGRVGALQIMVILPETNFSELHAAVVRLKTLIATDTLHVEDQDAPSVVIGGIAMHPTLESEASELTAAAEDALLNAQKAPDRVCLRYLNQAASTPTDALQGSQVDSTHIR